MSGREWVRMGGKDLADKVAATLVQRGSSSEVVDAARAVAHALPAMGTLLAAFPDDAQVLARGLERRRDLRALRRAAASRLVGLSGDPFVIELASFARREKLRAAARELLCETDVLVTARELSLLADVCLQFAYAEAAQWARGRFGEAFCADGSPCRFVLIGMGKLGGLELNAGSDIDLIPFYGTDDGYVRRDGVNSDVTLHEYFTRVTQRIVKSIEQLTEAGFVWRVDLRLRPEGARGPLVNSLAAAERYYETFGRTWQRAALLRARACAGDVSLGNELLDLLAPFVWRRSVTPQVAYEVVDLLDQARAEAGADVDRDLKIGRGGIRAVEFFVQSLQLIWGGKQKALRVQGTRAALERLRVRGYVTDRECSEMLEAYRFLRRAEHHVQYATGLQTHALPEPGIGMTRLALALGYAPAEFVKVLDETRRMVEERLRSLTPLGETRSDEYAPLLGALEGQSEDDVARWLSGRAELASFGDLARHLIVLARRPHMPLGSQTRDRYPGFATLLLSALFDAADPEQAARLMGTFIGRFAIADGYVKALAEEPAAIRRIVHLFGASRYLGEALAGHPELVDALLFSRDLPSAGVARLSVEDELSRLDEDAQEDAHLVVGALRRAMWRTTLHVGLAGLSEELSLRDTSHVLTALADAAVNLALAWALRSVGLSSGLAVIGMGKFGGQELGYGSDLDLFFVYDGGDEFAERYVRAAQRAMRLLSMPHEDGPGYELDTALRPSGNQGLLVVPIDGFARYHDAAGGAHDWERQALIKARFVAGDVELGARVMSIAEGAAYRHGAPDAARMWALRLRMEEELGRERRTGDLSTSRFDYKVGRGGLVDVEFVTQWLQMKCGDDPRVRARETEVALRQLEFVGALEQWQAEALRADYRFVRRIEMCLRMLHGGGTRLLESQAPGLTAVARRLAIPVRPGFAPAMALLEKYKSATERVRSIALEVLGLPSAAP